MEKPYIIHAITPVKAVSPFDINMACDAGYGIVVPYTNVETGEVPGLVQDMIFSRAPGDAKRTGLFIAGRDILTALDMLEAARRAMVPPFEISVFADPSGAYTTAAAMIAKVESQLEKVGLALAGSRVVVFGGKGPVGGVAAVLAARAGASVRLVGHDGAASVAERAASYLQRFGVTLGAVDGSTDAHKAAILKEADVVLAVARAGVQVLSRAQIAAAPSVRVVADVNAVPPAGVEGVDAFSDGVVIDGTDAVGIGALAIGNVKFKTQHGLFKAMREATTPVYLAFDDAFALARAQCRKAA